MKQRNGLQPVRLLTLLALCQFAAVAHAQQQITSAPAGDSTNAAISADGRLVAFQSAANLDPGTDNGDGSVEIFTVDSDGSDSPIQITNGPSARGSQQPAISGDGTRIAFVSGINPVDDNADGNTELFVAETAGGDITQLTDTTGPGGIQAPSIARDGSRIAFTAVADLLGAGSNSDNSREVFAVDADGGNLTQLTDAPANTAATRPDISPDGAQVVYAANTSPTGDNAEGNAEIFLIDANGNGDPSQLTDTSVGQADRPSLAENGRIAFQSRADPTGGNPDGSAEIFAVDTDGSNLLQLTDSGGVGATLPCIAESGDTVVFQSRANLDDNNTDGSSEIFTIAADGGSAQQITNSPGAATRPDIAADGNRLVFQSRADLTGNNPDGNIELFLAHGGDNGDFGGGDGDSDDGLFCSGGSSCTFCDNEDNDSSDAGLPLLLLCGLAGLGRRRRLRRP